LIAVLVAGLLHIAAELWVSQSAAMAYNVVVSVGFAGYLVWRSRRSQGALRAWGMRLDNFGPAMLALGTLGIAGSAVLIAYGLASGDPFLPETFWLTVALYPVWGIAQQFALQNLVARNLTGLVSGELALALVASALFGLAHYPRLELLALTFVVGTFLTLVYRRFPNLWAVGIVHGILGSLAFYLVLNEDPGRVIVKLILGR
jgi:membrane protease YdiL (CAAX protease family)